MVPLFAAHRVASPGVILDEMEKVATGKHNGSLHDGLLGMLEPRTCGAWMDPYLQGPLDLSHVIWIATANSLEDIPPPLRDRFRIIRFPEPGAEHLTVLASSLMRAALVERGLDERWALPLDGMELGALAGAWRGGSIRKLARLVEGVLAVRDRATGVC